ncbi:DNA-binding barrel domain superfamily [Sesbania bispinosa]|nr:DNA-binding barrel domain superfamily [Sesbania bispinosa]
MCHFPGCINLTGGLQMILDNVSCGDGSQMRKGFTCQRCVTKPGKAWSYVKEGKFKIALYYYDRKQINYTKLGKIMKSENHTGSRCLDSSGPSLVDRMNGSCSGPYSDHLWTSVISTAPSVKSQPLGLPVSVVKGFLKRDQEFLSVVLPNGSTQDWLLIWNKKRKYQVHLGAGWYKFSKENNLKVGDQLNFKKYNEGDVVMITIRRR